MNKFPVLKPNEVALVRADHNTGIILDEMFNRAITDDQNVYTIFKSEKEALAAARKILSEKGDVEILIYGAGQECLYFLT